MAPGTSNRQTYQRYLPQAVLVLALVFAAWHVASHDVTVLSDPDKCKVCRLNQLPIAISPVISMAAPLLLWSLLILVIPALQRPNRPYAYTLGARGPPLY